MAGVSSYQERQDEEYQVLESIFRADLEDLRHKVAWKVARPLELRLTLKPQQSIGGQGQVYVQVNMVVKCSARYPDVVPEITLANWKGLSDSLIANLKAQLDKEAAENVGEVMLWQLATHVQEFLHKHNRPPQKSFHEQMMTNKKQQQEQKQEQERIKEEERRRQMEQEAFLRQEVLRNETRRRREDYRNTESYTPVLPPGSTAMSKVGPTSSSPVPIVSQASIHREVTDELYNLKPTTITPGVTPVKSGSTPPSSLHMPGSRRKRRTSTPKRTDEDELGTSPCKDHASGVSTLTFKADRAVQRGKCLGHSPSGSTVYAGMDLTSGDLVAVAEWVLQWRQLTKKAGKDKDCDTEGEGYLKQLSAAEQEFNGLQKLSHPNLIHYLAWRYQYDPGKITVHVLMEYSGGTNLAMYVHHGRPLPLALMQRYAQDLLQALKYLHQHSIVHKNLRASSVFVDSVGRVRLADYSIDKRLGDLYEAVDRARPGVHFSDERPMVLGRGGQRGDIYQLGLLVLSLVLGHPLVESIPDIPTHLPQVLQDFLHKCLFRDERLRWTAAQLLEHSFVKETLIEMPGSGEGADVKGQTQEKANAEAEDDSDGKDEENFEYLSSLLASGQSRLASEFDLLRALGKGGFGDVLKVKNKLDGRFYAIKRIPLNPKSKMFNKKMKREVKLLSRLNHENVVRYYCSWIEISDDLAQSDSSSSNVTPSTTSHQPTPTHQRGATGTTAAVQAGRKGPHIVRSIPLTKTPVLKPTGAGAGAGVRSANCSFDPVIGDIDNLVPRVGDESVEWLTSFDQGEENSIDSSSDEEEDEADVFGTSFMPKMDRSEDSIVFDTDETNGDIDTQSKDEPSAEPSTPQGQEAETEEEELTIKILYIQMEYCEKSTLRTCIDAGLSSDQGRMWRLFREIIDGLVHIHGQGIIHRDLKPVNIFLDSQDHVKIGDFGLATTDILGKGGALLDVTMPSPLDQVMSNSRSGLGSGYGDLTGKVGTALYISPEVMQGKSKVQYNQKVDIYSLGIIFFEMCYKSLPTGMERVKILSSLRLPTIEMPEDVNANKAEILRWLLNHDPAQRPTAKQLLTSSLLPLACMMETELSNILHSAVSNPASSSYRHLLHAVFSQTVSSMQDLVYDHEIYEHMGSPRTHLLQYKVESTLAQLFSNHGATRGPNLPAFLPKCGLYESSEQHVRMMDQCGGIVSLPLDLRVPFARYVGRHSIQSMKRFAIEKVYREKKTSWTALYNTHPRELTECAFDIITTTGSLIPDAETLTIVQEIINKYPALQARNYYIRINHMTLLKAVLLHCGIPESLHIKALSLLADSSVTKKKGVSALESELAIKLTEQASAQLSFLLDVEGSVGKVTSILRCITKTMSQASSMAKSGLHDLEHVISHAKNMGLKLQVLVTVGLVYNPHQYSGVLYKVMCDHCKKKKRKVVTEVFAAGGRYDKLIEMFTPVQPHSSSHKEVHGVGVSISLDRLVAVIAEDGQMQRHLSACDVLVCTLGHHLMVKERLGVARDLWAAGFRADLLFDKAEDFEDLQENCRNRGVSHIVVLEQNDSTAVKGQLFPFVKQKKPADHHGLPGDEPICFVKSVLRDGPLEKVAMHELVEFISSKQIDTMEPSNTPKAKENSDGFGYTTTTSSNNISIIGSAGGINNSNINSSSNSSSNSTSNSGSGGGGGSSGGSATYKYNIVFAFQDSKKHTGVSRPRHEALIAGKASAQYPWLPEKNLEVLALELSTDAIRTILAYLDLNEKASFEASIGVVMEKLAVQGKLRKYLVNIFDLIHGLRFDETKRCNYILLYSIKDETLRLLTS